MTFIMIMREERNFITGSNSTYLYDSDKVIHYTFIMYGLDETHIYCIL